MNESPLERRLRDGLARAADAIPEVELQPSHPSRPGGRDRRPFFAVAAAAAALLAGVVAITVTNDGSDDEDDVTASEGDEPGVGAEKRTTNGRIPGEAILDTVDNEVRFYDAAGEQTESVSIAPMEMVMDISSDLDGGFVVCGEYSGTAARPGEVSPDPSGERDDGDVLPEPPTTEPAFGDDDGFDEADEAEAEARDVAESGLNPDDPDDTDGVEEFEEPPAGDPAFFPDKLMWFAEGEEPVVLEENTYCADLQVIDSDQGPIVVRASEPSEDGFAEGLEAIVLATGESYDLPVEIPEGTSTWSVATDRLVTLSDGRLQLFDLANGAELGSYDLATAAVEEPAVLSLAPDGESVAIAGGEPLGDGREGGAIHLSVLDLAAGDAAGEAYILYANVLYDEDYDPEDLLRGSPGLPVWAAELSYDGTTVAVGGDDIDEGAPVTVLDIETEDIYTIDVFGQLL